MKSWSFLSGPSSGPSRLCRAVGIRGAKYLGQNRNKTLFLFFVTDVTHYWVLRLPQLLVRRLCHSPIQCVVMNRISRQILWTITLFFVLHRKYFFHIGSNRESNPRPGTLQHSEFSCPLPNCVARAELETKSSLPLLKDSTLNRQI